MNCGVCGVALAPDAVFCGQCGSSRTATIFSKRRGDSRPTDTTVLSGGAKKNQTGIISVAVDLGAGAGSPTSSKRIVDPTWFRLEFSTDETIMIFGTGLIGRKPMPQAGENFDHLVRITDYTRTVSKTHLQFGEHEGSLWVADRFTGNGTVLRASGEPGRRLQPGRRYLVPFGARVDLGDQYFLLK